MPRRRRGGIEGVADDHRLIAPGWRSVIVLMRLHAKPGHAGRAE